VEFGRYCLLKAFGYINEIWKPILYLNAFKGYLCAFKGQKDNFIASHLSAIGGVGGPKNPSMGVR
tara:strand:+ start:178 stop:372 length:195 start_codon:yes stop_codon:yes gene_type:complete